MSKLDILSVFSRPISITIKPAKVSLPPSPTADAHNQRARVLHIPPSIPVSDTPFFSSSSSPYSMSNDSYFPPTPPIDISIVDEPSDLKMSQNLEPNGAAPPTNAPTGTKDAPNRMALKLSHLPSRQKIKPVYPRSPSAVCHHSHQNILDLHICGKND